jgi:hypothetical protein
MPSQNNTYVNCIVDEGRSSSQAPTEHSRRCSFSLLTFRLVARSYKEEPRADAAQRDRVGPPMTNEATYREPWPSHTKLRSNGPGVRYSTEPTELAVANGDALRT